MNPDTDTPTPPASSAAPEAALPSVPPAWEGAFKAYKYSKAAVRQNLVTIVVLWLLSAVISFGVEWKLGIVGQVLSLVISSLFSAGVTLVYIAGVRRQQLEVGQALSAGVPLWLNMIGLNLLTTAVLLLSILLLVIPFFFVWPRVALANYFLVDKKLGVMEAFKASWAATKGNVGKLYGIAGAGIAMALLMLTIIGIPFSVYFLVMYSAINAVLYEFLNKHQSAPEAAAPAAETPAA